MTMFPASGNLANNAAYRGRPGVIVLQHSSSSSRCSCRLPGTPRRPSQWKEMQRAPLDRSRDFRCRAESETQDPETSGSTSSSSSSSPASGTGADRIKSTLSGLDSLLGIDPEEEKRLKEKVCPARQHKLSQQLLHSHLHIDFMDCTPSPYTPSLIEQRVTCHSLACVHRCSHSHTPSTTSLSPAHILTNPKSNAGFTGHHPSSMST